MVREKKVKPIHDSSQLSLFSNEGQTVVSRANKLLEGTLQFRFLPANFLPYPFQSDIANSALRGKNGEMESALVVMPTGIGKTNIAFLVADNRLDSGKILMVTPTTVLATQHTKSAEELFKLPEGEIACIIGTETPQKERAGIYSSNARIIVATSHAIERDIAAGVLDLAGFSLLVTDEAHHAVGDHPHNVVAMEAKTKGVPILALTASPGDDYNEIKRVISNLGIKKIEIRTVEDEDVKPYIQNTNSNILWFTLPSHISKASGILKEMAVQPLAWLDEKGLLDGTKEDHARKTQQLSLEGKRSIKKINYTKCLNFESLEKIKGNIEKIENQYEMHSAFSYFHQADTLNRLVMLFETQSIHVAMLYVNQLEKKMRREVKYAKRIFSNPQFAGMVNAFRTRPYPENPKIDGTIKAVKEACCIERKKLIFCKYREQAKYLQQVLCNNGIDAQLLLGKKEGYSQKNQKSALEAFRASKNGVLVSTSVGQEGMDIPSCDVIFYDQVGSAIDRVQRYGRTGRQEEGTVVELITLGTMDEYLHYMGVAARKRMENLLVEMKKQLST